uniref:Uncharacterized protein n=2 Tax=Anguilla anguilla TaxID=7936 RepID=A0A0E9TV60_ANGAN
MYFKSAVIFCGQNKGKMVKQLS